jgi:hypothetical protein
MSRKAATIGPRRMSNTVLVTVSAPDPGGPELLRNVVRMGKVMLLLRASMARPWSKCKAPIAALKSRSLA